jgi:hypothetical protein
VINTLIQVDRALYVTHPRRTPRGF